MRWILAAALLVPALAAADSPRLHRSACSGGHYRCFAQIKLDAAGRDVANVAPQGLGPTELQAAYRIPVDKDPGATIAVVDAYGYADLEADLAAYRSTYGLPPCTVASGCLTIVNQSGQTTPLPAAPPANDDWTTETALDVDMASAGCPKCKILVVQANSDRDNRLAVSNDTAVAKGATVVSNSWGGPEDATEDTYYTHPGVAIFASTGDNGYEKRASYPAASPNVIAVGGTTLVKSSNLRGWAETAWSLGGSTCSKQAAKPAWQTDPSCAFRSTSDVSAVGDPQTGVAVYAHGKWGVVGGTSASSPLVAAIYAVTGHSAEIGQYAYQNTGLFFDVPSGSNGTCGSILCTATTGWDGPTGIGSPNAAGLAGAKAPTLTLSPANNATVSRGFTITADCATTDGATIARVDVMVDQFPLAPLTVAPFTVTVPETQFKVGPHKITATCTTSALLAVTATASIVTSDTCAAASDCPTATDLCFQSVCIAGTTATNGLGATCTGNGDCASGACASDATESHCTITCDATAANSCPDGFDCTSGVCWPGATGGGCNTGGQAPVWLMLGLGVAFTLRRRAL